MTKVYYYLKRTQASAKEEEFNVPLDLRANKEIVVEKLFPLTISLLADISRKIIKGDALEHNRKIKQLEVIAKFFSSYYYTNTAPEYNDYLILLSAVAYYHIGQCGTASVLAKMLDCDTLLHQYGEFALLLGLLLNDREIRIVETKEYWRNELEDFVKEYNNVFFSTNEINNEFYDCLRNTVFLYGTEREILFVDVFLALAKVKLENSTYKILKKHSSLSDDNISKMLQADTMFREMWPAQRTMAEHGLFSGKSGIIQLPTGAGKTKSIALCIYAYQIAENAKTSVVVTPFRALTREVRNDLYKSLRFASELSIVEVSDLLQDDWNFEIFTEKTRHRVIVLTPEKLLYILEKEPEFVNEIGQIIFDEGHLFEDEHRGTKFELLISTILSSAEPSIQKILISAVVGGVNVLNKWITDGLGAVVDEASFYPAEKNVVALSNSSFNDLMYYRLDYLDIASECKVDYFIPRFFCAQNLLDGSIFPKDTNDNSIAIMLNLVQRDNCAVFCGTKKIVNSVLSRIEQLSKNGIAINELTNRNSIEEKERLCSLIKQTYGEEYVLTKTAELGVFAHHGGMTEGIKSSIEYALQKFLITNVICTSTLAQGVNIPIKYLIVSNTYQGNQRMNSRDFLNLIGRVGRPGMYIEGTIIYSNTEAYKSKNLLWNSFKEVFNPDKEKCYSTLEYLCITGCMRAGGITASYYEYIIKLYADDKQTVDDIKESIRQLDNEDGGKEKNWLETWQIVEDILGNIEWFLANYDDQIEIERITKYTLAKNNLSEEDGQKLNNIFYAVKGYLDRLKFTEQDKKMFAKSMISSDVFLKIIDEINRYELSEDLSKEEFLEWLIGIIRNYADSTILRKLEVNDLYIIANWWMDGDSYKQILDNCKNQKIMIVKRKNKGIITLDEIVSICGAFGYSATLILNTVAEYYRRSEQTEEWADYVDLIGLKLKYGLPNKEMIYIYELGFNDRIIATKVYEKLNIIVNTKDEVKQLLVGKKSEVAKTIEHFPSYYSNVLQRL